MNDSSDDKVDVEALISQNGDSSTLSLRMVGLKGPDMKIVADKLRNNNVRESNFVLENKETKNCKNINDLLFSIHFSILVTI